MDAFAAFLAGFHADDWKVDLAIVELAHEFLMGEAEQVFAYPVKRNIALLSTGWKRGAFRST